MDVTLTNVALPFIGVQGLVGTFGGPLTVILPASRPPGWTDPFCIGMVVDVDNAVAESNESNNKNIGVGADMDCLTILPPDINVLDSVEPENDLAIEFGAVVDDGRGGVDALANSSALRTLTITNTSLRSRLRINQNGISFVSGTHFRLGSIISNLDSIPVNLAAGSSLINANSAESWLVEVYFDPTATGPLSDTLMIYWPRPT